MTNQSPQSRQAGRSDELQVLNQRLYEEQDDIPALIITLDDIEPKVRIYPERDWYDLLAHAFDRMREATEDAPDVAAPLIITRLVPWLIASAPNAADYARLRGREVVREWLDQYVEAVRSRLTVQVLDVLHASLREHQHVSLEAVCWTIAGIGRRRPDLVDQLWKVANAHDDAAGDAALRALASLGTVDQERPRLLRALHKRLRRRVAPVLIGTMETLADTSSIALLRVALEQLLAEQQPSFAYAYGLQTLATIAAAHPDNDRVQDNVWSTIYSLYQRSPKFSAASLLLGSGVAPQCNAHAVVPDLLAVVPTYKGHEDAPAHQRHLLYRRAGECIRPRQLAGARDPISAEVRSLVERDAAENTGYTRNFATTVTLLKNSAWSMLLHFGDPIVLSPVFLEEAVFGEESVYVRGGLMERLASFRWEPLPPPVVAWITDPFDLTRATVSDALPIRKGATLLARSAATREAFEALLYFGFTFEHQALRDSATALASVALRLTRQGESGIVEALIDATGTGHPQHRRSAALHALEVLAGEHLLDPHHAVALLTLVGTTTRETADRRAALGVLAAILWAYAQGSRGEEHTRRGGDQIGDYSDHLWGDMRGTMRYLALSNGEIADSATEALAQCGALIDMPDALMKHLPLRPVDSGDRDRIANSPHDADTSVAVGNVVSGWELTRMIKNEWEVRVIATLYVQAPDQLSPAMATLLNTASAFEMMPLVWALGSAHGPSSEQDKDGSQHPQHGRRRSVPQAVRGAVRARLKEGGKYPFGTSEELIEIAARIMPTEVLHQDWSKHWASWSWRERRALADALAEAALAAGVSGGASATRDGAMNQLLLLMRDGQYAVRRAAYRSLSRLSPEAFVVMCAAWAASPSVGLRRRAAESLAWAPLPMNIGGEATSGVRTGGPEADAGGHGSRGDTAISLDEPSAAFDAASDSDWSPWARAALATIQDQLAADVDPLVRESLAYALDERQRRIWAENCLRRVVAVVSQKQVSNDELLAVWRYGHALIEVGDDDSLATIEQQLILIRAKVL